MYWTLQHTEIFASKINEAERVSCVVNFIAAIFSAPLQVLPYVTSEWPSTYRQAVFKAPSELAEWQRIDCDEESGQES